MIYHCTFFDDFLWYLILLGVQKNKRKTKTHQMQSFSPFLVVGTVSSDSENMWVFFSIEKPRLIISQFLVTLLNEFFFEQRI